ncbi:MAG: pilus assembly protein TadG-related protein [Burkholderiales bacterium]
MSTIHRRLSCERGSVLIAGLLLTVALLMLLGAAVDLGHAFIVRRDLTSQADDAALAGSQALNLDALHQGQLALDPQQAQTVALQAITDSPDLRASAVASTGGVTVHLQEQIPTVLLRLVGLSTLTVAAQATAAPRTP